MGSPAAGLQVLKLSLDGRPVATATTEAMLPESLRQDLGWLFERLPYALSNAEQARLSLIGEELSNFGIQLFVDLFDAGKAHRSLLRELEANIDRLRIEIIEPPQFLPELPWELMRRAIADVPLGRRVAQFAYMPTATVPLSAPASLPQHQRPLRVLLVIARPQSAGDVAYRAAAYDIVERYAPSSGLVFEILRPPTFAALQSRLQRGPPPDIVHFDGHGTLLQSGTSSVGVVLFEAGDFSTKPIPVRGSTFAQTLRKGGVQTLVLHACRSAQSPDWHRSRHDSDDAPVLQPAPSFATEVAGHGLTVVAMRYLVPVATAAEFASSFYGHVNHTRSVATAFSFTIRDIYETNHDSTPWSWLIPALVDASPPPSFSAAPLLRAPEPIAVKPALRPHWDPAFRFFDSCFAESGCVAITAPHGFDSLALAKSYARWFELTDPDRDPHRSPVVFDLSSIPGFDDLVQHETAPFVIIANTWAAFDEERGRWAHETREQFADLADDWVAQGKRVLLLVTDASQISVRPRTRASVVPQFLVRNPTWQADLSIAELAEPYLTHEDARLLAEICDGLPELAANVLTDELAVIPLEDRHECLVQLAEDGLSLTQVSVVLPACPSIEEIEGAFSDDERNQLSLLLHFRNFVRHDVLAEFEARIEGAAPFTETYQRQAVLAPILQRLSHFTLLIDLGNNGYRIHPVARPFFEKWWADRLAAHASPDEEKALADEAFCSAVADLAAWMAKRHRDREEGGAPAFPLEAGNIKHAFDIAIEGGNPHRVAQCLWALDLAQQLGTDVGFKDRALLTKNLWSGLSLEDPPEGMTISDWLALRLQLSRISTGHSFDSAILAEQTAILCAAWPAVLKYRRFIGRQAFPPESQHAFEVWLATLSAIFFTSANGRLPSPATSRRLERAERLCEQLDFKRPAAMFCQYLAILNYGSPPDEDEFDGNLDMSEHWAHRAANLNPSPQNLVTSQFRLGMVAIKRAYQDGKQPSDFLIAKAFFERALSYSAQETEFGESLLDLSDVYRELMFVARQAMDLPGMEDAYRNAVRYALERDDLYSAARTKGNHASALYYLGRETAAMQYRAEAISDLHAVGHPEALELAAWYKEQWAIQDSGG